MRHGESEGNQLGIFQGWLDLPLTQRGRDQARQVAMALAGAGPLAAIYTSPLRRAAATAEAIGEVLGATPIVERDLRELDCGDAAGLTWAEFARRFPERAARVAAGATPRDLDDLWPNGERVSAFRERCRRGIATIVGRHAERSADTVVVVAHGGSLNCALGYLLGADSTAWPHYDLPNASISEVVIEGGRARAVRIGDVTHLAVSR